MIFDHCKWDPQCGDHAVLGRFPLLLESQTVDELGDLAEQLTQEALALKLKVSRKTLQNWERGRTLPIGRFWREIRSVTGFQQA